MSVVKRTGFYGEYYGNDFNSSNPLTEEQMQLNAKTIYGALTRVGWTDESIAAILGNMEAESTINPGRWQNENVGNTSGGYGLVQWTPATKYINWINEMVSQGALTNSDPSELENQIVRINEERNSNIQWIPTSKYNYSFEDFSYSNDNPGELAKAFMLCYERPADQSLSKQSQRANLGKKWYTFLTGIDVPDVPITPGGTSSKKKKFKFILFKRRFIRGQR